MIDEEYSYSVEEQNVSEGIVRAQGVEFEVGGDPIPKGRPRAAGHIYTPTRTKKQEKKIRDAYEDKYEGAAFEKGVPLRLETEFFFGVPKSGTKKEKRERIENIKRPMGKGDIDNLQKTVADALNGVAFHDDSQIVEMVGRKYWGEFGKTVVRITRLDG